MNNIILSSQDTKSIGPSHYEVTGKVVRQHLKEILGLSELNELELNIVIPEQGRGLASFNQEGEKIYAKVKSLIPTKKRRVHLAIATTRPLMAKRVLEHATTMGAASFHFFSAQLSEKSYFDSKVYSPDKADEYIRKGMAQCSQYTSIPHIFKYSSLEHLLEKTKNHCSRKYWLHHGATQHFSHGIHEEEIMLFIGPERGWTEREMKMFRSFDMMEIKLSDSVMRVEFAVNAAFSQLEYIANSGLNV